MIGKKMSKIIIDVPEVCYRIPYKDGEKSCPLFTNAYEGTFGGYCLLFDKKMKSKYAYGMLVVNPCIQCKKARKEFLNEDSN